MNKTIFELHRINIAKKTLKMPDAMADILGGMTKQEARKFLEKDKPTILLVNIGVNKNEN